MKLTNRLIRSYALYTLGFLLFIYVMWRIERTTGPGVWIGYVFLFVPIAVYAVIGLLSRTSDLVEYYVAGRRVPSVFNGMATAADWLSAASFIGLAGSIYATGYDGLAYLMGWTGGYCLVAFLLAPYVRKLARYTIPDFLGTRFSSNAVRGLAALAAILCSFVYLVAQIQGVGLDCDALYRRGFRGRHFLRTRGHSRVFVSGRHACGDVDPGRAIHHPDRGDSDSRVDDRA